ncbi:aldehyde dehydrogenase family protein, partial [Mycolicibacter hiberniae]
MTKHAAPGTEGSAVTFAPRYENFIGGEWVAPAEGQYFDNTSPIDGKVFTQVARGTAPDIEKALDAAHAAAEAWGNTSPAERSNTLLRIADRIEQN